ncbi:MAG: caspase family protein [Acidobacteria bacterium]|nr:caspase family protein [Acidobacteriota bacterium]
MRQSTIVLFILLLLLLPSLIPASPAALRVAAALAPETGILKAASDEVSRQPFALDLPELGVNGITATETVIQRFDIQTLRLRVLNPYANLIDYGKTYILINGEAAKIASTTTASTEGQVITCNLASRPYLRLHAGKNVVEIIATDRNRKPYYASFVLRTGKIGAKDSAAQNAVMETVSVASGNDKEPPVIYLEEPKGVIQAGKVRVVGVVMDNSGVVESLTINGAPVMLSAATQGRGMEMASGGSTTEKSFVFERAINVAPTSSVLIIEAKDRAGNVTRVALPVRKREAAVSAQFSGRKLAVIIGISDYRFNDGGLTDLSYCDADARAFRDFLQARNGGGFAANDILLLENQSATLDAVRSALRSFLSKAGANDLVLLFLAGHGSPDPYAPQNLYFLMHDTKVANMETTALPMTELQNILNERVKAERVVVFVDTCHSAGLSGRQMTSARGLENNLINLYAARLFKETGRAILTSSDVSEASQESKRWGDGHGIFTFALLEGLKGEADFNHDRFITAGELFSYVRNRVSVETGFKQNPTALPGLAKDLTLAYSAGK